MGYTTEELRFSFRRRKRSFSIPKLGDELCVFEESYFRGGDGLGLKIPTFSAEVKDEWNSADLYVFKKNQASRYFTFTLHLLRIQ